MVGFIYIFLFIYLLKWSLMIFPCCPKNKVYSRKIPKAYMEVAIY